MLFFFNFVAFQDDCRRRRYNRLRWGENFQTQCIQDVEDFLVSIYIKKTTVIQKIFMELLWCVLSCVCVGEGAATWLGKRKEWVWPGSVSLQEYWSTSSSYCILWMRDTIKKEIMSHFLLYSRLAGHLAALSEVLFQARYD